MHFSTNSSEQKVDPIGALTSSTAEARQEIYAKVSLTTDISLLSDNERKVLPYLIRVAKLMDEIFWKESIPESVIVDMGSLTIGQKLFYDLNYGPWDRLVNFKPFVVGIGEKPIGTNFYPADMTKAEFEAMKATDKSSLYTVIIRDDKGQLTTIPYHKFLIIN